VLWPRAFFDVFAIDQPRYPAIWQCLGMVVGLYGLGYAYAALHLDRAAPFIAIGLLGKVLGPVGWVITVSSGQWPPRTLPLVVFDDVVWWLPFALFLIDRTRLASGLRRLAPVACAGFNAAAAVVLLLVLRPGTQVGGDQAGRVAYITQHSLLWRGGWAVWMLTAMSLLAFYAWWGARIPGPWAIAGLGVAALGLVFDLTAESLFIGWLPRDFATVAPPATLLTGIGGNGLYTVAGILLTLRTPNLRGRFAIWTWTMWAAGLA
jgi:hypothetical protein